MYSFDEIEKYVHKYSPEGIIVDTNVLLMLLLGKYDCKIIEKCKLTSGYFFESDIVILDNILRYFRKVFVTPHIVAEISNLSKKEIKDPLLSKYFESVIAMMEGMGDVTIALSDLIKVEISLISKFGFTDMALFEISKQRGLPILTRDFEFATFGTSNSIPVINFSNIRASVR